VTAITCLLTINNRTPSELPHARSVCVTDVTKQPAADTALSVVLRSHWNTAEGGERGYVKLRIELIM